MKQEKRFRGFSVETLKFLTALARHTSDKSWFESHRSQYEQHLLQPLRDLVVELGEFMLDIDPCFEISPAINKTISRIYRDTRFSRDKSLFKRNMWISFKRPSRNWQDDPGYFFEISAKWYRYGMGFYNASAATMRQYRAMIDEKPAKFLEAVSFYSKRGRLALWGESYKRILDGSKSPEILPWYQFRNIAFICERDADQRLFSRRLMSDLKRDFLLLKPIYLWLREAKDRAVEAAGEGGVRISQRYSFDF